MSQSLHTLSSVDAQVFEGLTTPALQILAVAGPVSGREGERVVVPTGEFMLWPALLSLAATRVDVVEHRGHLQTAAIESVKEYEREYEAAEQGGPRLGQPVDLVRLRVGALDRCLLGFVKRAIPLFHDEDADWILRQAVRVAHDAERRLIERGLILKTFSPCQSFPVAAVLGLMPHPLPVRTAAGDALLTAFREACTAPGGHPAGDFAVNRTLLLWMPQMVLLFVDLLRKR